MTIKTFVDGSTTLDAADLLYFQQQMVLQFSSFTTMTGALVADAAPITGQLVQILDDGRVLRYDGAAWTVVRSVPTRLSLEAGGAVPTDTSAAAASVLGSTALKLNGVYEISGFVDHAHVWKLSMLGANVAGRITCQSLTTITTFDQTSATSVMSFSAGAYHLRGRVTASADTTLYFKGYASGSAVALYESLVTIERVG